ncbi:hypothetical protein BDQ12DRAFT_722256 [Crucibulum laeve]|uniref:Uncharacterized protein n=1 Tax=Crucibulum laeve TaxID=68775 RepID=A0A5C3M1X4_9AGAR|nr:hypothetical protein BDQ12DRAFT_722256 [Crucibulum laeve]
MSPSHSYTVGTPLIPTPLEDDDDDSDICPVCDGECTCRSEPRARPALLPTTATSAAPLSMAELSLQYAASSSASARSCYSHPPAPSPAHSSPTQTQTSYTPAPAQQSAPAPKPSLKIKLTVPPGLLKRRVVPSIPTQKKHGTKYVGEMTSAVVADGYVAPSPYPVLSPHSNSNHTSSATGGPSSRPLPDAGQPRKRGRPPKALAAAREAVKKQQSAYSRQSVAAGKKKASTTPRLPKSLKDRALVKKKVTGSANTKRRRIVASSSSSSSDEFSDIDRRYDPDDEDDASSVRFPTFVSASALSSMDSSSSSSSSSSDDSSSLSGFSSSEDDEDDEIKKEEENFIRAEVHDKARVKRELLGDEVRKGGQGQKNDWVIRPRKKSVGLSDVEMDVDSDATEDDEEEDEEEEAEGEAEPDESAPTMTTPMDEEPEFEGINEEDASEDGGHARRGYVGLATGWSDDEESSFDADLFFANLADSSSSSSSDDEDFGVLPDGDSTDAMSEDDGGDMMASATGIGSGLLPPFSETHLPFEVTESWDGQIMFTNGLKEGQGILDMDFEANASTFIADTASSSDTGFPHHPSHSHPSHSRNATNSSDDIEMSMSLSLLPSLSPSPSEVDPMGYEEDSDMALGEGGGDTTDEELVGEDDLPNERAMQLFNLPFSVSAINPLSTVSPGVSPCPRSRGPYPGGGNTGGRGGRPKPSDILSGLVFWDSEDEFDRYNSKDGVFRRMGGVGFGFARGRAVIGSGANANGNGGGGSPGGSGSDGGSGSGIGSGSGNGQESGLRMGVFVPTQETRQAVIDGSHREVPSPHPRFNRKGRGMRYNTVELLLRKTLLSSNRPSFVTALESSPLQQVLSSDVEIPPTSPEVPVTEPIELDDVLEASFLDPDPSEASSSTNNGMANGESDSRKHFKSLSRWDLISVGAFRHTRNVSENGSGWGSDTHHQHGRTPGSSADYGNIMKSSPLSAMLWPNNEKKPSSKRRALLGPAMSPAIVPVRDGDRTPTPTHVNGTGSGTPNANYHTPQQNQHQKQKHNNNNNNKSRKELKREKKLKKSYGNAHTKHQHHHHSHHHPNSKTRSSASSQRSNFFASGVPPLNL